MLIANRFGYKLLNVFLGRDEVDMLSSHSPVTAAMVIALHGDGVVLGYNRFRGNWEAPAGRLEAEETARQCAHRELLEESCQVATDLQFVGLAEMTRPSGERKYTAVYKCYLPQLAAFEENSEWNDIRIWDCAAEIGDVDPVDATILRRFFGTEGVDR